MLLNSTTVTGLQHLINCAVSCISNHGLRFNVAKTKCMTFGNNPFKDNPKWNIEGTNCGKDFFLVFFLSDFFLVLKSVVLPIKVIS